jgi:hypothetical protein
VLSADRTAAAHLFIDTNEYLRVGSSYVNADMSQKYIAFSLIDQPIGDMAKWAITGYGMLTLQSPYYGFCASNSNGALTPYIVFSSPTPFSCLTIIFNVEYESGRLSPERNFLHADMI